MTDFQYVYKVIIFINKLYDFQVNVSIKSGESTAEKFKEYIRTKGTKEIQDKLGEYVEALRKGQLILNQFKFTLIKLNFHQLILVLQY